MLHSMSRYVYMAMELAEWGKGVLKLRRMVMGVGAGPAGPVLAGPLFG